MAVVRYAPRALLHLERLADFLLESEPVSAARTVELIIEAIEILRHHPQIGRPGDDDFRELIISRGRTGCVALYVYDEARDVVLIAAIRHQREAGFT